MVVGLQSPSEMRIDSAGDKMENKSAFYFTWQGHKGALTCQVKALIYPRVFVLHCVSILLTH